MIVLHRNNNGRRIVMAKATQPSTATVIQDRARDCPGADPLYRRGTITKGAWEASTTVGVTRSQPKHRHTDRPAIVLSCDAASVMPYRLNDRSADRHGGRSRVVPHTVRHRHPDCSADCHGARFTHSL